ncbi:Zinc metalloproteinase nas-12 [Gossypium arboreum]|uniref:Zinc metalloproteinase nas-12 n=1 Tax=Gossypium arboreum TaxID=29729 RepID=A0A0B0NAG3_GOSAR|nr:Zinc metalloproteinase nas-12 [Gossypium arboreum]
MSHGRVPAEPKYSPIQKRILLRALRHFKAYLTPEEALRTDTGSRRQGITQEKPIGPSQKPDSSSRLKISLQFLFKGFGFSLCFVLIILMRCFLL